VRSAFPAAWLAQREPADRAARSAIVTDAVVLALPRQRELSVVDLGAGTGANLRYLAPRLPAPQAWKLVDHDRDLLALAQQDARQRPIARLETHHADLARLDAAIFAGAQLVTASALLDLVSDAWLTTLADRCAERDAAVLFALNYDGRIRCTPSDPGDEEIAALVNTHQRTDKGFGPALGPDAAGRARELFEVRGYEVVYASSEWRLGPSDAALQRALVDGWARAAAEMRADRSRQIERWRQTRVGHIAAGCSLIVVGHEDVGGTKRN
jgi:SAM-dependent methyltransferase